MSLEVSLHDELYLYFDGACTGGNPGGTAAFGWLLKTPTGEIAFSHSGVVCKGQKATNNVAEWHALGRALRYLVEMKWKGRLHIRGDSQLVIRQLNGEYECKKEHLIPLRNECRRLLKEVGNNYEASWVKREDNIEADFLSKEAAEGNE